MTESDNMHYGKYSAVEATEEAIQAIAHRQYEMRANDKLDHMMKMRE